MHDPRALHMKAIKRILRYLKSTVDYGLHLLHSADFHVTTFSYAD